MIISEKIHKQNKNNVVPKVYVSDNTELLREHIYETKLHTILSVVFGVVYLIGLVLIPPLFMFTFSFSLIFFIGVAALKDIPAGVFAGLSVCLLGLPLIVKMIILYNRQQKVLKSPLLRESLKTSKLFKDYRDYHEPIINLITLKGAREDCFIRVVLEINELPFSMARGELLERTKRIEEEYTRLFFLECTSNQEHHNSALFLDKETQAVRSEYNMILNTIPSEKPLITRLNIEGFNRANIGMNSVHTMSNTPSLIVESVDPVVSRLEEVIRLADSLSTYSHEADRISSRATSILREYKALPSRESLSSGAKKVTIKLTTALKEQLDTEQENINNNLAEQMAYNWININEKELG